MRNFNRSMFCQKFILVFVEQNVCVQTYLMSMLNCVIMYTVKSENRVKCHRTWVYILIKLVLSCFNTARM